MGNAIDAIETAKVVSRNPAIHSGDLVFTGTRVPVENLIGYLKHGDSVETFLEDFPSVERWQVEAFLDLSAEGVSRIERLPSLVAGH